MYTEAEFTFYLILYLMLFINASVFSLLVMWFLLQFLVLFSLFWIIRFSFIQFYPLNSLSRISLALNIITSPPIPLLPSPLQIMLYNIPLPQPFISNLKKTCIKSTLKLGSYLKIPYFCTRFPREESLSYLTNCKSVNQVKTKNKKTSKKFWKQQHKVLIFALRFAKKPVYPQFLHLVPSFPFDKRALERAKRKAEKKLFQTFGSFK